MSSKYNFRKRPQRKIIFNRNYELSDDDCDYDEVDEKPEKSSPNSSASEISSSSSSSDFKSFERDFEEEPNLLKRDRFIEKEAKVSTKRGKVGSDDEENEEDEFADFIVPDPIESDEEVAFETAYLASIIETKILDEHPALEDKKVYETIENALKAAERDLLDRFCDIKDEDNSWKLTLPKEKVQELETVLESSKKEIKDEEPTMEKILATQMLPDERRYLIKLFGIYQHLEPFTKEHMKQRDKLINFLRGVSMKIMMKNLKNKSKKIVLWPCQILELHFL